MTYAEATQEAVKYYALCRKAERLGVPTSLDDPKSPQTVAGLAHLVSIAENATSA